MITRPSLDKRVTSISLSVVNGKKYVRVLASASRKGLWQSNSALVRAEQRLPVGV